MGDAAPGGGATGRISEAGFRAASEVVERFIASMGAAKEVETDPTSANGQQSSGQRPSGQRTAFRQLRADLARAVDTNLDLIRKAFDLYAGAVDRLLGGEQAPTGDGASHLTMPPVLPGHQASSTLWIHNTTTTAAPGLRLHASDLVSHTGDTIHAAAFEFDPAEIDIAPPGASLAVAVSMKVEFGVPPGRYRGHVFVTNLPSEYLTVEVEVVGPVGTKQEDRLEEDLWRYRRRAS